jgi:hypothetical protein
MSEPRLEVRHINGRYWDVFTAEGERVARLDPGVGAQRLARLFAAAPGLLKAALFAAREIEGARLRLRCLTDQYIEAERAEEDLEGAVYSLRVALGDVGVTLDEHGEEVPGVEGAPSSPSQTARPLCKVEGCTSPVAPEGNGQDCPYTCEEHAPGWGVEWGFCGRNGTCYRRAARGAIRCSLHGGRDYEPAGEPRCEDSVCGRQADPGSRYCRVCLVSYMGAGGCAVWGCGGVEKQQALCEHHFDGTLLGDSVSEYIASLTTPEGRERAEQNRTARRRYRGEAPANPLDDSRCNIVLCEAGCGEKAAEGSRWCREGPCGGVPCAVRGCEGQSGEWSPLCRQHQEEWAQAGSLNLFVWLASRAQQPQPAPEPRTLGLRLLCARCWPTRQEPIPGGRKCYEHQMEGPGCLVAGCEEVRFEDGGVLRPMCRAHNEAWERWPNQGRGGFEEWLAQAGGAPPLLVVAEEAPRCATGCGEPAIPGSRYCRGVYCGYRFVQPPAPLPVPSEVTVHGAPAGEDTAALTEALRGVDPEPLTKRCVAGDCQSPRREGGALCTEHAREVR